jgi:hypothetical protein
VRPANEVAHNHSKHPHTPEPFVDMATTVMTRVEVIRESRPRPQPINKVSTKATAQQPLPRTLDAAADPGYETADSARVDADRARPHVRCTWACSLCVCAVGGPRITSRALLGWSDGNFNFDPCYPSMHASSGRNARVGRDSPRSVERAGRAKSVHTPRCEQGHHTGVCPFLWLLSKRDVWMHSTARMLCPACQTRNPAASGAQARICAIKFAVVS